ncbi:MAG: GNAT family N-acetyltransferase [Opitutaceae bacterium]|jgi:ribosomal-protein-alanine N-acetyltransferase|nr:GNAT family N-acetyltransferase [Opitutaceae bacterium]MBP9913379.1 GNAT family N-acetyltransferase [Opitutaceae bacterium]
MNPAVSIRPAELSDAADVQKYASDLRLHATCNLPSPYPEGGAVFFLTGALKAQAAGEKYLFAVIHSSEFAGLMGLNDFNSAEGTAELDYWIALPFWGRGIATNAAALVIEHAFRNLGLKTLFSSILIRNPASRRVVERNGFKQIGELVYDGPWPARFGGERLARYHLQNSAKSQ